MILYIYFLKNLSHRHVSLTAKHTLIDALPLTSKTSAGSHSNLSLWFFAPLSTTVEVEDLAVMYFNLVVLVVALGTLRSEWI